MVDPGPAPSYFWTKLRPEGPKKFFLKTGPPFLLSKGFESPKFTDFGTVIGKVVPPLYKSLKFRDFFGAISSLTFTVSP